MAAVRFPNLAQTTLTGAGIGIAGASFTVAAAAAFGAADFYVRVEHATAGLPDNTQVEFMRVTNVAGSTFTVTKGLGGTADQAHAAGDFVTAILIGEALVNGLVQQLVGSATVQVTPGTGQGIVTVSIPTTANLRQSVAYKMRATSGTSTQNLANGTHTKITLGTEDFDPNNNFTGSTYTVPQFGYYLVTGKVHFDGTGGPTAAGVLCEIWKNGAELIRGHAWSGGANKSASAEITQVLALTAGDTIELYGYHETGATIAFGSANAVAGNFLSIHYLSE